MEQDNVFVGNQSLRTAGGEPFALLLAAHGERRQGAGNETVAKLTAALSASNVAAEVGCGFLKGVPTIGDAIRAFSLRNILIYPLFMSDGYFTRVLLPQLVEETTAPRAETCVQYLTPFGLDPQLADLVIFNVSKAVEAQGIDAERTAVVLCAHGSQSDGASRRAANQVAEDMAKRQRFGDVRVALLEEPPELGSVLAELNGPVVVVGLFVSEGLHGGRDIPLLVAESNRTDVIFAGNVGMFPGVENVIAAAVRRATLRAPLPDDAND